MSLAGKFTDLLTDGPGSQPIGNFQVGSVSTRAPSDAIIVPDANLLFNGDFKRSGVDLIPVPTAPSWFDLNRWWTREREIRVVLDEYIKLGYYTVYGCPTG